MKCSVFIATSVDGYIATHDGSVDWLQTAGKPNADMTENVDMGFGEFLDSVDCMIMGRNCMEVISSMDLSPEQWPYGDLHIVVLSNSISEPPDNLRGKVEMFSGEISDLVSQLEGRGYRHAYIDGGSTITTFLNLKLIDEMTITQAPVLLGEGTPLFGTLKTRMRLENASVIGFPNDFVQIKFRVHYG